MPLIGNTIASGFYFGASSETIERAKELRMNMTPAEAYLWSQLRRKSMNGFRFRRQHPVSRFIVDFYCHAGRLVIEIDGNIHDTSQQKEHDLDRSYELEKLGLRVIRFTNAQVFDENALVLRTIWLHLENKTTNKSL
jgi:very-short-patch-repair endonuclease